MWYTLKHDGKDALMFFNGLTRSVFFADDTDNGMYQRYLAWVAEGNEATEWTGN